MTSAGLRTIIVAACLCSGAAPLAAQETEGSPPGAASVDCGYDQEAMLGLDQSAFDQDMTGGWRALANRGWRGSGSDPRLARRPGRNRPRAALA